MSEGGKEGGKCKKGRKKKEGRKQVEGRDGRSMEGEENNEIRREEWERGEGMI